MNLIDRRPGLWVRAVLLSIALSACAGSPQTRLLLADPPEIPPRVELAEVPFFPQQEYHCGPAALAAVINFRGTEVVPSEIAELVYLPGLKGSLQVEIVAATRQFDLLPVRLDGRLDSLLRELAAGNPVFVLQNLGLDAIPVWHYEVVIGYHFEQREFILRSGTRERIARSFALFEKTWARAGNWALAVVAPDTIPASAGADAYLDAVIGLEQVGRIESASRGYRAALRRWPDHLLALSGFANTSYALGDFGAAETAYRSALETHPDNAGLWNNLAYALARQGRREESMQAIRHALELEPNNPGFRESLEELESSY